jgi:hypothetical protein
MHQNRDGVVDIPLAVREPIVTRSQPEQHCETTPAGRLVCSAISSAMHDGYNRSGRIVCFVPTA